MEEIDGETASVRELFGTCDLDGSGYIDRSELGAVCDLDDSDLSEVFQQLDLDNDGKISVEEFSENFQRFANVVAELKTAKANSIPGYHGQSNGKRNSFTSFKRNIGIDQILPSSQQYVSELYYNLTNCNQPDLVELFEKHLASVVKDIKARASENQRLEEALKRATKQHARQVSNLDREVEQQLEKLEAKVREEEKVLSEKKLSDLQWQIENKDNEISSMNKTLETLQGRLNKECAKPSNKDEIEAICQENRFLKSQVTDSQTALALLRSELAELRSELVEQSELYQKEHRTLQDSLHEQENLSRQLQLLHEANQRLHDVNDELRGALEAKRKANSPRPKSADVMKLSGVFSDPGRDLSASLLSSKSPRCRSATPSSSRAPLDHNLADGCENSFNEDSLFSEIHRASTILTDDDRRTLTDGLNATTYLTTTNEDITQKTTKHFNNTNPVLPDDEGNKLNTRLKSTGHHINPEPKTSKFSKNTLARIMTELSTRKNEPCTKPINKDQRKGDFLITKNTQTLKSKAESNEIFNVQSFSQDYHFEKYFQTDFTDRNGKENCADSGKLILDKDSVYDIQGGTTFCDEMGSCIVDKNGMCVLDNQMEDKSKSVPVSFGFSNQNPDPHKKCVYSTTDINVTSHRATPLHFGLKNADIAMNAQNPNQVSTTLRELGEKWFDNIECTYEQFEEFLKKGAESGYLNSSPPESFDLTSVSSCLSVEPYKSDVEEDEAYGTMAKHNNNHVQKQIQILEDTNMRLSSSNDELRVALKLISRSSSFRKPKKPSIVRRTGSFNSDYGSLSSRSSRSFSSHQKKASTDVGEATDESTTYDVEDDDIVGTIFEESRENAEESVAEEDESIEDYMAKHPTKTQKNKSSKSNVPLRNRTRHGSLDFIDERTSNNTDMRTRSQSLNLFYARNFSDTNDLNNEKENSVCNIEDGNNNETGLWDITRRLNTYERMRSQSLLEKLETVHETVTSFDTTRETSSDEDSSESDTDLSQASDSTTMNSETVADLEAQFSKIKEGGVLEEEQSNEVGHDDEEDDDDDDDVNSKELEQLVAMASDLTDNSMSDSESGEEKGECQTNTNIDQNDISNDSQMSNYGTPERMYKLVLAGDAAVGKSSFILRLCRNKFHSNLNATLGVDFQVKNITVDSKTVALQLWDTAGQERFRSIAKSYFRKVDGVLLLYDVTCESSFVNIREWMQTIQESSQKKVPIMLCANKCDLREEFAEEGRKVITTESGEQLASNYNALFLETSAKDGKHIQEACKQLARILTSLENEEIEQSGLKLDKRDREKKKRPCCPS